jgi:hypothetical protein
MCRIRESCLVICNVYAICNVKRICNIYHEIPRFSAMVNQNSRIHGNLTFENCTLDISHISCSTFHIHSIFHMHFIFHIHFISHKSFHRAVVAKSI